ncbi:GTPase RsgA [Klebsiella pneumoniae]
MPASSPVLLLNKADLSTEQCRRHRCAAECLPHPGLPADRGVGLQWPGDGRTARRVDGHVSVFVEQSGGGKSSLVNALLPGVDTRVGDLSTVTGKGTRTTTTARLFPFPAAAT